MYEPTGGVVFMQLLGLWLEQLGSMADMFLKLVIKLLPTGKYTKFKGDKLLNVLFKKCKCSFFYEDK